MSAVAPDLAGTGLDLDIRPVWIEGASPKQRFLVHPNYLRNAHTKADMSAVVTFHGEPISQMGETLTIGLIPPWRRFAVGPVIDGKAEVLTQQEFERMDEFLYLESFRLRGERPDDHSKRFVPNVVNFVKVKLDPMQKGRICPLGTNTVPQKPIIAEKAYDAALDRMVDRATDETTERMRAELAEKDARLAKLEATVNALVGKAEPAKKAKAAKPAAETVTSQCGEWTGKPGHLRLHVKHCKKGCAAEAQVA
jgi:hypothetical protein